LFISEQKKKSSKFDLIQKQNSTIERTHNIRKLLQAALFFAGFRTSGPKCCQKTHLPPESRTNCEIDNNNNNDDGSSSSMKNNNKQRVQ
jgi:hypothetical protein